MVLLMYENEGVGCQWLYGGCDVTGERTVKEEREEAVKTYWKLLQSPSLPSVMLQTAAWVSVYLTSWLSLDHCCLL